MIEKWKLPDRWEWISIPEICQINPRRPRLQRDDAALTSFVPMQSVDELQGTITDMLIRPFRAVKRGYTYFEENDVLMAKITPSMENGKAAIAKNLIDGIGFGTTEFHVFRPNKGVAPEWIFYYIRRKSFRDDAKRAFRGAVGQQRVPEDFLYTQSIPIPYPDDPARSLAEQRRIVARLEALLGEVRAMRELVEEMEKDIDRVMESALTEVFAELLQKFDKRQLGNQRYKICTIIPGQHILSKDYNDTPHGTPYITGPADYGAKYPNIKRWTDYPKVLCQTGDVLLTVKGSGVGKVNCAPKEFDCAIGRQIMALRPNPKIITTDYLFYFMQGEFQRFQALRQGVAIPGIRKSHVASIEIPLPPLPIQKRVVTHLDAIQEEVNAARKLVVQDLQAIDRLEQSILAAAFRGEV